MVGAEMPMTSDQVIWSEQNRLHVSYNNVAQLGGAVLAQLYFVQLGGNSIKMLFFQMILSLY